MASWGWRKYVSVGEKQIQTEKKMDKMKKKGKKITPIEIQGRTISKSFWGKAWCDYIESFSDYDNRLPRGRTYVRNGSVCHLEIEEGVVKAIVSGSSLYNVKIQMKKLSPTRWKAIKGKCSGEVGSLLELLQGKISDHVMSVISDEKSGLFPEEKELEYECDCPDWANMCKHVAAVFYGVANRLDSSPDLLFLLRGVDPEELTPSEIIVPGGVDKGDTMGDQALGDIFGIEIDASDGVPIPAPEKEIKIKKFTGKAIAKLRKKMKLSVVGFAEELQVTPATIYRWERSKQAVNLREKAFRALTQLEKGE